MFIRRNADRALSPFQRCSKGLPPTRARATALMFWRGGLSLWPRRNGDPQKREHTAFVFTDLVVAHDQIQIF